MNKIKQAIKTYLDGQVNDCQDRTGCSDMLRFTPDELQELVFDIYDDVIKEDRK